MKVPFRIAVVATQYKAETHADVIVSRWLQPHPKDEAHGWIPITKISSMYVMQIPDGDISRKMCALHGIPQFDTVWDALTLGGGDLAVDGILIIGEHGEFPHNNLGQKLYPRKELFDQVVEVFRQSKRVVPVFFDKHLSWDPSAIHEMYWQIKEMEIPFFGGSSISLTPLSQPLSVERPPVLREVMALYWHCLEPYLFHSLELAQTLLERRASGETGAISIIGWKGESVWDALDRGEFSAKLLEASAGSVAPEALERLNKLRDERHPLVYANQLIYPDGLKVTHFMQEEAVKKWCLAYDSPTSQTIPAAWVKAGGRDGFFNHFAGLNRQIQDFFLTGRSPIPLERLYFTSMATAACMQSFSQPGQIIPTPTLKMPPPRVFHR